MLFKMGKFYEMFEMDAHIGAEVLGLTYMKAKPALPHHTLQYSSAQLAGIAHGMHSLLSTNGSHVFLSPPVTYQYF